MGFLTEMFARPRPQEHLRYRAALALLHSMSNADRADTGINQPTSRASPAKCPPASRISRLDRDISSPIFQRDPMKIALLSGTPLWRRMS